MDFIEDFIDLIVVWLVILIILNDFFKNVFKKMSKLNIIIGVVEEYIGILYYNINYILYLIFSIKFIF